MGLYAGFRDLKKEASEESEEDLSYEGFGKKKLYAGFGQKPLEITVTDKKLEEVEDRGRVSRVLDDPDMARKFSEYSEEASAAEGFDGMENYLMTRSGGVPVDIGIERPEEIEDKTFAPLSFKELAESPRFLKMASNYLSKRVNPTVGNIDNYDSPEDFIERYMEHTRALSSNMVVAANELDWIRDASEEEKRDAAKLYQLTPNLVWGDEGFTKTGAHLLDAVKDYALYTVTDPSNVIGLGSGFLVRAYAKHKLSNAAMAQVLKSDTAAMIGMAGLEGTLGFMEAADRQSIDIEAGLREGKDLAEIGIQAGLQGVFGAGAVKAGTFLGAKGKSTKEELDIKLQRHREELKDKRKQAAQTEQEAVDIIKQQQAERTRIIDEFDPVLGRRILDDLMGDPIADGVIDPQVKREVANDVYYAVLKWADSNEYVRDELLKAKSEEGKRISDVVFTLVNSDKLDETKLLDDLRDSLASANVTQEQFGNAMRTSLSDAAKLMRDARTFQDRLKKMAESDPDSAEVIARITGADDSVLNTSLGNIIKRADRETRALMVAGLGTTVRNVFSGVNVMGMRTAVNIGDAVLYQADLAVKQLRGTITAAEKEQFGLIGMFNDSFGLITRLAKQGESMELAERFLKGNDELFSRLFHDKGEMSSGTVGKELSGFARAANTLNRVQDGFFRRAVFTERVQYYMRKRGLDWKEYISANKPIPKEILREATDDSLKATFAYMPKQGKSAGETLAHYAVKINENLPFVPVIGTADIPFMRFATNAIGHQYKNSPMGLASLVTDKESREVLGKMLKGQDANIDPIKMAKVRTTVAQASLGFGLWHAATAYREDNPDMKWYEMEDEQGRPVDMRSMYPVSGYLLAGEVMTNGFKNLSVTDALEAYTGITPKTGAFGQLDKFGSFLTNISQGDSTLQTGWDKFITGEGEMNDEIMVMAEDLGFWLGDQAGRVLTPAQILSDVIASVDEDELYIRDKNRIEATTPIGAFGEAAAQSLGYKAPGFQQMLPELTSPTREEPIQREGASVRQVIGARVQSKRNPIETELAKHGFENYDMLPRTKVGAARAVFAEVGPEFMELLVGELINTTRYEEATPTAKKQILNNALSAAKGLMQEKAEAISEDRAKDKEYVYDFVGRSLWLQLPQRKRKLAVEEMKRQGLVPPSINNDKSMKYHEAIIFANKNMKLYEVRTKR